MAAEAAPAEREERRTEPRQGAFAADLAARAVADLDQRPLPRLPRGGERAQPGRSDEQSRRKATRTPQTRKGAR